MWIYLDFFTVISTEQSEWRNRLKRSLDFARDDKKIKMKDKTIRFYWLKNMFQVEKFLFDIYRVKIISDIVLFYFITIIMKKIVVYLMWIFILSGIQVFAASCAKEWQTYNNWMDAQWPFSCCSGLKWFTW
jgi:hypothetical protein